MEKDFDYYVPFPVFSAQTPTLIVNPDSDLDIDLDLEIPYPLKTKLIEFEFCEPYPKKPAMVDYMFRSGDGILSEKINQALSAMNIKSIQLIPATIANPTNREIYGHYYFLHIHNYLECMYKEKSV